jgi:hypothetical protein
MRTKPRCPEPRAIVPSTDWMCPERIPSRGGRLHDFRPRLRQASMAAGRGSVADVSAKPFYAAATAGIARLHLATKSDSI